MTRRKRPRFNGSADDHAATELLASITPAPGDGTTWQWGGTSDIGVMVIEMAGPEPPAARPYAPYPDTFPALPPAAPQPAPAPASAENTDPAVIGDALRLPVIWCEMPRCIGWHHDPASTGYADTRERAAAAGWRTDALGRLACPPCQQARADYRTPQPLAWHHKEVARRWNSGEPLGEEAAFRLGVVAEYCRRISRENPAWAEAMAGATARQQRRTAGAS